MKLIAITLALASLAWAGNLVENVNARYIVESVSFNDPIQKKISNGLRADIEGLIGQKFDPSVASDLAKRIHKEVRLFVTHKIERGRQPDHVRLVYTAERRRWDEQDAEVTKLAYHSRQGWTGGLEGRFDFAGNGLKVGVQSDGDALLERFAGVNMGVTREIGQIARLKFDFETYHQQWNAATISALAARSDVPGIYRERYNLEPGVEFLLTPNLKLTAAVSFQSFQTQFPAARYQASNAVETTLRHHKRWGNSDSLRQELDAGYTLRAATRLLGGDYVYNQQTVRIEYEARHSRSSWNVRFLAGALNGNAPLFDRFVLGNTQMLRGWSKYEIAPLGGDRVVHGSLGYRFRAVGVFYDTGSISDRRQAPRARHAVGATVALGVLRDGPYLTLAFPLRDGSIIPLFMMGMNF
jgi:hypothetical protein